MAYIKQLTAGIGSVSIRIEEHNLMLREPHLIIHFETVELSIIGKINLIRTEAGFKLDKVKLDCPLFNIIITDTSQLNRITNTLCILNECNWQNIANKVIAMYPERKVEGRSYITQDKIHQFHMSVAEGIFPTESTRHSRYGSEYFNGLLERIRIHNSEQGPYTTVAKEILRANELANQGIWESIYRSAGIDPIANAVQQPVVVSTPTITEPRSFMDQIRRFERYIRTGQRDGED
jgi:hypothetical protein